MKRNLKTIGLALLMALTFNACSETYNYTGDTYKYMNYHDEQITKKIVKDNNLDSLVLNEIIQTNLEVAEEDELRSAMQKEEKEERLNEII